MATMVLPIRELSVNAQREAVSAQHAYIRASESIYQKRFQLFQWISVRALNYAMARLSKQQQTLIEFLKRPITQRLTPEDFRKISNDLENVVSLTDTFIDEAYNMPRECVGVWSARLTKIAESNRYLDNFAESFRIASDEACTALLADIADRVSDDEVVSST